tara:strand:+ start:4045 stop:4380 length:336 start_codon:yes stop_codon:yes gene_type:complete
MTSLANQGASMRSFQGGSEGGFRQSLNQSMGKTLFDSQVIHANDVGITANRPLVTERNDFLSGTGSRRISFTTDPNQITRRYVGPETPFQRRMRVATGDIGAVHYLQGTRG